MWRIQRKGRKKKKKDHLGVCFNILSSNSLSDVGKDQAGALEMPGEAGVKERLTALPPLA
jgi:hypothetical protein